eukprot:TRINITY_DN530_c0_g1_i1.p1 TRINITY_DN530_c0_g1~~TRINITY_DN530_c0_g1_i1.p1  ORF type:complete len:466 (+),score=84.20 TRINITY_DN530_c0_g1_i1:635-2032(+)
MGCLISNLQSRSQARLAAETPREPSQAEAANDVLLRRQTAPSAPLASLSDLLNINDLFAQLHARFAWILTMLQRYIPPVDRSLRPAGEIGVLGGSDQQRLSLSQRGPSFSRRPSTSSAPPPISSLTEALQATSEGSESSFAPPIAEAAGSRTNSFEKDESDRLGRLGRTGSVSVRLNTRTSDVGSSAGFGATIQAPAQTVDAMTLFLQQKSIINSWNDFTSLLDDHALLLLFQHVVVGSQIIIRTQRAPEAAVVASLLSSLIPSNCRTVKLESQEYRPSYECNFLGLLAPLVDVPPHVDRMSYVIIDLKFVKVYEGESVQISTQCILDAMPLNISPTVAQQYYETVRLLSPALVVPGIKNIQLAWERRALLFADFRRSTATKSVTVKEERLKHLSESVRFDLQHDVVVLQFWRTGITPNPHATTPHSYTLFMPAQPTPAAMLFGLQNEEKVERLYKEIQESYFFY